MSRVGDEVHRTMPALTMSEKILAKASGNESVRPGQIVDGSVDLLYMHEMLAMALIPFGEIGTAKVWDPTKIVVTLDHWVPPPTPEIAKMHQTIRDFCRSQGRDPEGDRDDRGRRGPIRRGRVRGPDRRGPPDERAVRAVQHDDGDGREGRDDRRRRDDGAVSGPQRHPVSTDFVR